jgi:hypothetical protein
VYDAAGIQTNFQLLHYSSSGVQLRVVESSLLQNSLESFVNFTQILKPGEWFRLAMNSSGNISPTYLRIYVQANFGLQGAKGDPGPPGTALTMQEFDYYSPAITLSNTSMAELFETTYGAGLWCFMYRFVLGQSSGATTRVNIVARIRNKTLGDVLCYNGSLFLDQAASNQLQSTSNEYSGAFHGRIPESWATHKFTFTVSFLWPADTVFTIKLNQAHLVAYKIA